MPDRLFVGIRGLLDANSVEALLNKGIEPCKVSDRVVSTVEEAASWPAPDMAKVEDPTSDPMFLEEAYSVAKFAVLCATFATLLMKAPMPRNTLGVGGLYAGVVVISVTAGRVGVVGCPKRVEELGVETSKKGS